MSAYSTSRIIGLTINALGGARAMEMALDRAGDLAFTELYTELSDDDDLPKISDYAAFFDESLGGYEVCVLRRGYSNEPGGGEFDADYAIIDCSPPKELFLKPSIQDDSDDYMAAKQHAALCISTGGSGETRRNGRRF